MNKVDIKIFSESGVLPEYKTSGASGVDISTASECTEIIEPGCSLKINTGIFVSIPDGFEFQVRPRSGLAFNHDITVVNSPGTIDSDYTGEICVKLINHGKKSYAIKPRERIAQLVLVPVLRVNWNKVSSKDDLDKSERGSSGFGSSGTV